MTDGSIWPLECKISADRISFGFRGEEPDTSAVLISVISGVITVNTWYKAVVTGTKTGSDYHFKLYVDGVYQYQQFHTGTIYDRTANDYFTFGCYAYGLPTPAYSNYFSGKIGYFSVLDYVLQDDDIWAAF
jgi:hypothetical protein